MYYKKEEIVDIKSFSLGRTLATLNTLDQLIEFKGSDSVFLHDFGEGMQELDFKHFHYLNSNYGQGYYVFKGVHSFEKHYIVTFCSKSKALTIKDGNTHTVNLETKEIEISLPKRSLTYLINENLIFRKFTKSNIETHSLMDGSLQWNIDVSNCIPDTNTPIEIKDFVGVYEQNLWVQLNTGNLIAINKISGKIVHKINGASEQYCHKIYLKPNKDGFHLPSSRNKLHLDMNKGEICGESLNGLWKIDLNKAKPSFEIWGMETELLKYDLDELNYSTTYHNDSLFFVGMKTPRWGIIDLEVNEVSYVSEPILIPNRNDSYTQLKKLKANDNEVYVLDNGGTLHVYQETVEA